jgi:hypothetical protein
LNRFAEIGAGFVVLLLKVIPAPDNRGDQDRDHNGGNNELVLVFDCPVGGHLGRMDGGASESVLLKLATGFCAHELPF